MSEHTKDLNDTNFQSETQNGVALVDFWAPWCGPCRMQGPIIEKIAEQMLGQVTVAKVNVDESPTVAASFGVSSIPTLVLLRNGEKVQQFVGVRGEDELLQAIKGVTV
ncbi:thioredoxin [Planctomycetota bacterium]